MPLRLWVFSEAEALLGHGKPGLRCPIRALIRVLIGQKPGFKFH